MKIEYSPLDRDNQEIRLLELLPGNSDRKRKLFPTCRIFHACLPAGPRFTALSYVWGDVKKEQVILVDESPVFVTKNLYEAMMALQPVDEPLVIWIDALCINQTDDDEKSWQVGLMQEIYRQAHQVLAWLGIAEKESDSVIDHLDCLGGKAELLTREIVSPWEYAWQSLSLVFGSLLRKDVPTAEMMMPLRRARPLTREDYMPLFGFIDVYYEQKGLKMIRALKHFITRPWWGRIWVLQEIALPENALFVCGTKMISRDRCAAAIRIYGMWWMSLAEKPMAGDLLTLRPHQLEAFENLPLHRPTVMLSVREVYRNNQFTLAALLRATCVGSHNLSRHGPHHMEATDPRDKIYALLGLASDREELKDKGIIPNYSRSCTYQDLYSSVMVVLIQAGYISLLSLCQHAGTSTGLPSWVPDWSSSVTHMLQDVRDDHVTIYPTFFASGKSLDYPEAPVIRKDGVIKGILLKGHVYDEISRAGSFPGRASSHEVPVSETLMWPSRWLTEFLLLTYHNRQAYKKFEDRLRAASRSSIGEVGWGEEGLQERIGDSRFDDAVVLLRDGLQHIRKSYIKLETERFLAEKANGNMTRPGPPCKIRLANEIMGQSLGRLPFITRKGHLVLSYDRVEKGDMIALIKGSQVPFVLRRQDEQSYLLIGEAYVDGIMDGEAVENSSFGDIHLV
uniref:Heterokaryon incompatibility domain-containing protein n=1 Tax=Bionectria ochroleuca TaxID=29856 RepID=A0A0B7KM10_BIOOC